MTHKTGPREAAITQLTIELLAAAMASRSGATMSETFEAIHEVQMHLVKTMLKPWEDTTCPTCPKDMQEYADGRTLPLADREAAARAGEREAIAQMAENPYFYGQGGKLAAAIRARQP